MSTPIEFSLEGKETLSAEFNKIAGSVESLDSTVSRAFGDLQKSLDADVAATGRLETALQGVHTQGQQTGSILKDVFGGTLLASAAQQGLSTLVGGVKDLAGEALTLAGNMEQSQKAMAGLLGSADQARAMFAQLKALDLASPVFDLQNLTAGTAALLGAGDASARLVSDLKDLGSEIQGRGQGPQQLQEAMLAYEQVISKGKLQGQEILQFNNALVPVVRIVADYLHTTTDEVQNLATQGKITSQIMQDAFHADAVKNFSTAIADSGSSWNGVIASAKDLKEIFLSDFGQGITTVLAPKINELLTALQNPAVEQTIIRWGQAAGQFALQLWSAGQAVAGWLGITLPAIPPAPDFSQAADDWTHIASASAGAAANARDYDGEIAGLQSRISNIRDQQAAIDASYATQTTTIRDQQATLDAGYATQTTRQRNQQADYDAGADRHLSALREQARVLQEQYDLEQKRIDLTRLDSKIGDDEQLAGDIFSSAGASARSRLADERQQAADKQRDLSHTITKDGIADQEAAATAEKQRVDQGYQARLRGIETAKQAEDQADQAHLRGIETAKQTQDQAFQALARGYERQVQTLQDLKKEQDAASANQQKDTAADTAAFQQAMSTQASLHAGTMQTLANGGDIRGPQQSLFDKIFGTPADQQAQAKSLAEHFSQGLVDSLPTIAAAGVQVGAALMRGLDEAVFGQKGKGADDSIFTIFSDIGKGDWQGAVDEWAKAKSRDYGGSGPLDNLAGAQPAVPTVRTGYGPNDVQPANPPPGETWQTGHYLNVGGKWVWIKTDPTRPSGTGNAQLGGSFGPDLGTGIAGLNGAPPPGRASGGAVAAGQWYQVDDARLGQQEFFRPATNGYIDAGGSGGGTHTVTVEHLCPACLRRDVLATIRENGQAISQAVGEYERGRA